MASSKLSDSDKQVILELYRGSEETTTSLAERYRVSTSTISRVLKQALSPEDYSRLIRQKRGGRTEVTQDIPAVEPPANEKRHEKPKGRADIAPPKLAISTPEQLALPTPEEAMATSQGGVGTAGVNTDLEPAESVDPTESDESSESTESLGTPRRVLAPIRRRRTSAVETPEDSVADTLTSETPPSETLPPEKPSRETRAPERFVPQKPPETLQLSSMDWEEEEASALDGDDDYGEEDEDEGDTDDLDGDWPGDPALGQPQGQLEILPFAAASLQRSFYLVIDRASELVTCPLKEFAELGGIPMEEEQSSTLPVFENQRLARRFSRSQLNRVIKLPDGQLLQKTQPYLEAKGITRLLIEGQVYALSGVADQPQTPEGAGE